MFDIKKIQEQIIFTAVKNESDEMTASQIINHPHEDTPTWVKSTIKRLEDTFDDSTVKKFG